MNPSDRQQRTRFQKHQLGVVFCQGDAKTTMCLSKLPQKNKIFE